jgi:hypothetical protein
VTVYEWLLIGVLVLIPVALVVFRPLRRHGALLLVVWLTAVLAWLFLTEHRLVDCLLHGQFCS